MHADPRRLRSGSSCLTLIFYNAAEVRSVSGRIYCPVPHSVTVALDLLIVI